MLRLNAALLFAGFCLVGCGPDHRRCSGPHPDFVLVLARRNGALPADTVVHVNYGASGMEDYDLAAPSAEPEVVFCSPSSTDGGAAVDTLGSAGGPAEDAPVEALRCELWTGGFASVTVHGTGLSDGAPHHLSPDDNQCTVRQVIVLDSSGGG